MAVVKKGYFLSITLQDSGFNSTTIERELRGSDFATASTNATAYMTALATVTDAKVARYSISERWYDNAFSAPVAGEVEELGIVSIRTTGGNNAIVEVPAPKAGVFVGTSGTDKNIVNLASGSIMETFLDEYEAVGGSVFVSDGEAMAVAISGQRGTKKSRQRVR